MRRQGTSCAIQPFRKGDEVLPKTLTKADLPAFIGNVKMAQFYFKNFADHSDSMMEVGTATAACPYLPDCDVAD